MGKSNIGWTGNVWNVIAGCTHISPGCKNCYAAEMSERLARFSAKARAEGRDPGKLAMHEGVLSPQGRFNGVVNRYEAALSEPLRVKKPTTWFVNSMSDLFHEAVPFDFVDRVFAVMALTPRHTYQILTKRPERMAEYFAVATPITTAAMCGLPEETHNYSRRQVVQINCNGLSHAGRNGARIADAYLTGEEVAHGERWPLPNVHLGASVEREDYLGRVHHLLECPAAVRFLSCEPLLGALDLTRIRFPDVEWPFFDCLLGKEAPGPFFRDARISWVIVGGESGPNRRPMELPWLLDVVAQCQAARVPVFVKQDSALKPGQQGRIPAEVWALKQFPRGAK